MNRRFESPLFWGSHSPLSALTGSALVIMASGRFSFALICAVTLVWVFGLSALIFSCARKLMPSRGETAVLLFLSAFLCGFFMILVSLLNPLLVLGTSFMLVLVPSYCLGSGFFKSSKSADPADAASRALLEAITLSGIILAAALIREPLGMGTLSVPGGPGGITELIENGEAAGFFPIRILSVSAGGFLLLGYGTALYRYFREQNSNVPSNSDTEE